MDEKDKILEDYSSEEKGAYLGAIASIAMADHQASTEELEFLSYLADVAGISAGQKDLLLQTALPIADDQLNDYLNILKTGGLKFSLIADLILFAMSDLHYSGVEKETIQNTARHLDICNNQFSQIEQFVNTTLSKKPHSATLSVKTGSATLQQDEAGINPEEITRGLLGADSSPILSRLKTIQNSNPIHSDTDTGKVINPNTDTNTSDGLHSLIGSLSGQRGFGPSAGLLSRILGSKNK